jgi:DNA-binding NtrC family response regulator
MNKPIHRLSPAAQQKLLGHHWPGNVRELRNVLERAVILENTPEIQAASLPEFQLETRLRKGELPTTPSGQPIDEVVAAFERDYITHCLERNRYSLTRTAEDLGITRHALRYRMQRLNIHTDVAADDDTPVRPADQEATPC